ncbi:hypothetical protein TGAM01_v200232, partial [Trichoderma gamsii]
SARLISRSQVDLAEVFPGSGNGLRRTLPSVRVKFTSSRRASPLFVNNSVWSLSKLARLLVRSPI